MSLSILLVDDDPLMHRMLLPRLEALAVGPPVAAATGVLTPDAALAALPKERDGSLVVISDFNLKSSMNGLQLLTRVQETHPASLRVLFSGYSLEQLGDVRATGVLDAFLEKPLLLDDLVRPLEDLIRKRFG